MGLSKGALVAPSSSYPSHCSQTRFRELVGERNFHPAIDMINQWIQKSKSDSESAFLLVEKAKILYADQQHTEAQEVFLTALSRFPKRSSQRMADGEKNAFDRLLPNYEASIQSEESCLQLLDEARTLLKSHPEYHSLEHYIAACLANRGEFIEFFDCFFKAFQACPDCFLSDKIIGVLHLRLFEAMSSQERREAHRRSAVQYLKQAFSQQPHDSTLLVKLAYILPPNEKAELLQTVVADLIGLQSPIRRTDCFFLIKQAIDVRELGIARQLVDKARSWYQYSRALNELSDQIASIEKGTQGN